jgi:hypothetical protein
MLTLTLETPRYLYPAFVLVYSGRSLPNVTTGYFPSPIESSGKDGIGFGGEKARIPNERRDIMQHPTTNSVRRGFEVGIG